MVREFDSEDLALMGRPGGDNIRGPEVHYPHPPVTAAAHHQAAIVVNGATIHDTTHRHGVNRLKYNTSSL